MKSKIFIGYSSRYIRYLWCTILFTSIATLFAINPIALVTFGSQDATTVILFDTGLSTSILMVRQTYEASTHSGTMITTRIAAIFGNN